MHYHFTDKETFERDIAEGKFLEYAYVHNNIYGTSIKAVKDVAEKGKCCILDIDVQGARQVRASGLPAIFAFISPPSLDELERRLRGRGTESEEQITTRLTNARDEMASLEETGLYDHILINSDLDSCFKELQAVAARALAGETGLPEVIPQPGSTTSALREPASATISLRGWLGDTGSPLPVTPLASGFSILNAGLNRWRGRVALVTGASSGVGWALALGLAYAGIKVVAVSRRKSKLEALQEAASSAGVSLNDFLPVVCDLTKEAEVTALPRIVTRRWPGAGIDILINAVGAGKKGGAGEANFSNANFSLLNGNSSSWVEAISAGVLGTALVSREAVSDMKKRGETGHVVNITCCTAASGSGSAHNGSRGMQAVAAAASRAMAEELRAEIAASGANVRVSCVVAGAIAAADEQADSNSNKLVVDDIVAAVAFCLTAPPHADVSEIVVRAVRQPPPSAAVPVPAAAAI